MPKDASLRQQFEDAAFENNWDAEEQVDVLFEFIKELGNDEVFEDFLAQRISEGKGPNPEEG